MSTAPFFMTHHAPVGAWSSLTFGLPGRGISIDHEDLTLSNSADFLLAFSQGPGTTTALPFISPPTSNSAPDSYVNRWKILDPSQLRRTLTTCIDEYASERITLRVYTPHPSIPNPKRSGYPQFSVVPGLLMEITIDNSHSDQPAQGFVGLAYHGRGRLRPMDWSTNGGLVGVGLASNWALAALPQKGLLQTLRDHAIADHVDSNRPLIHNNGNEGGILINVGPRETKTIPLAFGFYHGGPATQGIEGAYYYTKFFLDLEAVCTFILRNVGKIKESCDVFDKRVATLCPDEDKRAIFSQGLRTYNANTQMIESNGIPYYSVNQGQDAWRNPLDLAVDHLPWELYRNPWVTRNIFDLYSAHYSYRDELIFPADPESFPQPGGLSFTHDVGSYTTYSPETTSAYEMPDQSGPHAFMTTESLLNGIYLLTSYALMSDDEPWSRTRLATARELLDSLEARDHHDPAQRNGIVKAESTIVGIKGHEITTFDNLDNSLRPALGNIYLAFKTWCANLLLTAYFQQHHDEASAQRAYNMAHLTAQTLAAAFDPTKKIFPANLIEPSDAHVLAALEPLAIPTFCNLTTYFHEFPDLLAKLKDHAQSCLQLGVCIDSTSQGLRLTSTSELTSPAKLTNILYVLETVLSLPPAEIPTALPNLRHWSQSSAAQTTLSDQINSTTGKVAAASAYPRLAAAALWIKPPAITPQPTTE